VPTKGSVPRFFAFDPGERFLYVANQGGHSIVTYKVGAATREWPAEGLDASAWGTEPSFI
jgi:6-phosphogluconolactonase (cycloisomerase 2 family)